MSHDQELTREEEALEEIGRTSVSPLCAALLIALFVIFLVSVALVQQVDDILQYRRGLRPDAVPESARLEPLWSDASREFRSASGTGLSRLISANRALLRAMGQYETRLEDASWMTRVISPPMQYFFTRRLGIGNEKVYCGEDDELFYRPDVDYVTGPGFLDPTQMHHRRLTETGSRLPVEPNPLPAIRAFDRDLKAMGIRLIVMPVPSKPTLRASALYTRYPDKLPLPQNPSYDAFVNTLRAEGIDVFDCLQVLSAQTSGDYLKSDTHWLPSAAEETAEELALHIRGLHLLPDSQPIGYTHRQVGVGNKGDIAALLRLPATEDLYALERVKIKQVLEPNNRFWERPEQADILVLGDSFANIYSLSSLNWGVAAGLVEQLSYYLQRPVARITLNDKGAYATRQELARRQNSGVCPLEGTKVLVWEFAARELAQGDWRLIEINP